MTSTTASAHRAGRLILAAADRDTNQVLGILNEVADTPGGLVACVLDLASVVEAVLQAASGEQWRSQMVETLNLIEVDG